MTTYSALIADDEPLARLKLRQLVEDVPWLVIAGESADGISTVESVNRLKPDMLFLDVRMPGLSGLEVVRQLRHVPHIVFTTAFDEYAVDAFELQALDYLVKPFGRTRFAKMLERLRIALSQPPRDVGASLNALADKRGLERFFVRTRAGHIAVAVADVLRFEAQDDYVCVHTDSARHLAALRMDTLERVLDSSKFVRIHRSHIVNIESISSLAPQKSGRLLVTLSDGTELFASRGRAGALRKRTVGNHP